jgi:type II secretory pathway pseudopilin PulG
MKFVQKGFTLIELVIYMGMFSILIGVMSSLFGSIVEVQLESTSTSSVNQDGRYLLSKLLYDVKSVSANASGSAILVPANPGNTTNTLQITLNSINYTYSLNANGNLQVVNGSTHATDVLNSYDTSISGLTFTRVGNGGSNDTVNVAYTITSRTKESSGQQDTESFQTTLGPQ